MSINLRTNRHHWLVRGHHDFEGRSLLGHGVSPIVQKYIDAWIFEFEVGQKGPISRISNFNVDIYVIAGKHAWMD